ncbi:glycine-rich RNA-binding protein 2, mitochondrial isoform X1 [Cajanus cajan]|nr:glycine-rich RNA-binding protein 2, mitochondrial isoform X1 [Cajanus cajan]
MAPKAEKKPAEKKPAEEKKSTVAECVVSTFRGLSYDTNEPVLRDAFGQHGEIIEVKIICDHVTGKSRGYGFVRFVSETIAATARKEMHAQILDGRRIRVSYAHKG